MRKNPYNKALKDQLPVLMQGPSTVTVLITNEAQTDIVEKSIKIPSHKYEVNGVTFTVVQPPFLNQNGTVNPLDILKTEMGRTEVTQELFEAVMGWNDSRLKTPKNPVEKVTWFDCIAFCNKLSGLLGLKSCYKMSDIKNDYGDASISYAEVTRDESADGFRLPTEYEWESFAKAGTQNSWSGTDDGSELGKYAWYTNNSGYLPHPVGEKLPNEWGLYDMTGNVYEWCWDKYEPEDDTTRVVRGGSYVYNADTCRVADRDWNDVDYRDDYQGFRICRTIE